METSSRESLGGIGLLLAASILATLACSSEEQAGGAATGDGDEVSTGRGDDAGDGDTGDGDTGDGDTGDGDEGDGECYSLALHSRPAGDEGEFAPLAVGIAPMNSAVVLTDEGLGLISEVREIPDGYLVEDARLVPESDLEASAVRIFDSGSVMHLDLDEDGSLDSLTRLQSASMSVPVELVVGLGDAGMGGGSAAPVTSTEYNLERVFVQHADVGDINDDGHLDYVYASEGGVDVLLGQGDGTFGSRWNVTSGDYLEFELVVGDVDADGTDEIVTADDSRITVWEMAEGMTFSSRSEALNVRVADIGWAPVGHPFGPALIVAARGPALGEYPECSLECETDDACTGEEFCAFGVCVECRGPSDCEEGYCGQGSCRECLEDAHCGADGNVCASGECKGALSELDGYTQIELGHSLCALRDGALTCRGVFGTDYELDEAGPYTEVGVSLSDEGPVCALRPEGTIECFSGPVRAPGSILEGIPSGQFSDVQVGVSHVCALDDEGKISCWGEAEGGLLDAPTGAFTSLALGDRHSCALTTSGAIECWGCENDSCSDGEATPPTGSDFVSVSASFYQSCALRDDGVASCWGNSIGFSVLEGTWSSLDCSSWQCCGNDRDTDAVRCSGAGTSWAPTEPLYSVSTVTDISCGLRDDGTIQCSEPLPVGF